jgi:hypothetical protein
LYPTLTLALERKVQFIFEERTDMSRKDLTGKASQAVFVTT